jgi:hypothetical protein
MALNTNTAIEELSEMVFSAGSTPRLYSETREEKLASCCSAVENVREWWPAATEVEDIVGIHYQATTSEDIDDLVCHSGL